MCSHSLYQLRHTHCHVLQVAWVVLCGGDSGGRVGKSGRGGAGEGWKGNEIAG